MSLFNVFDVSGSALNAQSIRLNTTASNLANSESVGADAGKVYKARHPVFQSMVQYDDSFSSAADDGQSVGVKVLGVVESQAPAQMLYQPGNPLANKSGYVFGSNVNAIEEMTNMISASRSFQSNIDAMNTARDLLLKTISMGR